MRTTAIIATILLSAATLHADPPSDYIFYQSFENDWTADTAPGSLTPTVQNGTTSISASGISGKAASIGSTAQLAYSLAGGGLDTNGTLNAWIRMNTTPRGLGSLVATGMRGIFGESGYDLTNGRVRIQMNDILQYAIKGVALESEYIVYGVSNVITKDEWHMLTFTWDSTDSRMYMYLDGQLIVGSDYGSFTSVGKDEMYIGSLGDAAYRGLNGLMDEVKIYNRTLDKAEVMELWLEHQSVNLTFLDTAVFNGEENDITILWRNYGADSYSSNDIDFVITDDSGTEVDSVDGLSITIPAGGVQTQTVQYTPSSEGSYNLTVKIDGETFRTTQMLSLSPNPIRDQMESASGDKVLIDELDLGEDLPADHYIESPGCAIVDSPIGKYRECSSTDCSSGFAVKFNLPEPYELARPYILEVDYPDDKNRMFPVLVFQHQDGDSYVRTRSTDGIGIVAGCQNPVSNQIRTKSMVFWPDSRDIIVGAYVWNLYALKGKNPAIAKIRLYAPEGGLLPAAEINYPDSEYASRELRIWDEDPTTPGEAWFAASWMQESNQISMQNYWKKKWEHIAEYLHYTGQTSWSIKLYDYWGDNNGSVNSIFQSPKTGRDGYVAGWGTLGAKILQRENIDFYVSLHDKAEGKNSRSSLPGLIKTVGEEYIHPGFAAAAAAGADDIQRFRNDNTLVYDHTDSPTVAKLNPLHPVVQAGYLKLVRGYAEQFGHFPNFKGLHFLSARESALYFHNSDEGYSDYNVGAFNADTSPSFDIPEFTGDTRFSDRYDWLVANGNLEEWLEWRTVKIHEFHQMLADELAGYRPDLKLMISLAPYPELCKTIYNNYPRPGSEPANIGLDDYWRGCGIDFSLYNGDSGISIIQVKKPFYYLTYNSNDYYYNNYNYRYCDYDKDFWSLNQNSPNRSAMLSMHGTFELMKDDTAKSKIPYPYWGWTIGAGGAYNDGSLAGYAAILPSGAAALAYHAHAIAENDALTLSNGWWTMPDAGEHEVFRTFHQNYLSIPAEDFADVPGMDDPVKMRVFNGAGAGFFYLVNREAYPATVTVSLSGVEGISLVNRGTGARIGLEPDGDDRIFEITLKPYELLCFEGPPTMGAGSASTSIAQENIDAVEDLLDQYAIAVGTGDNVYQMGLDMLNNQKYSDLHYLMESQPVKYERRRIVSGTVSGDTASVELFLEGLDDHKLISDITGAYAFERIGRGEYTITPRREGFVFTPAQRTFTVTTANITGLDFTATSVPYISIADDGDIAEGSEDGEAIAVTLSGASFSDPLTPANWTVSNLPDGVSWSVTRGDATHATITLSGNASADYDSDITDVTVSCSAAEQDSGGALSDNSGVVLAADDDSEFISISDDGEIIEGAEDGEVITVTLSGGSFADPLDPAKWFFAGQPAGVSIGGVARIDATHAAVTLSGDAAEDYDSDILDFTVNCAADQFSDSDHMLSVGDGVVFTAVEEGGSPAISIADDGSIVEGAEDGEVITVTLSDSSFSDPLTPANWTVSNLPAGVSKGAVTRVGDTTATIALSGNRTADYDTDITTVTVQCAADEHSGAGVLSDNTGVTLTAVNETVSYSASSLSEAAANDGSIDGSINLDVTGDDFAADVVSGNHVTASNVPAGLSASFVRQSGTRIVFSLTGNAAAHADSDDVSNLAVTFDNDAFATLPLSFISGANRSDLGINFNDPAGAADIYVATTGSDLTGDGTYDNPYATIGKAITEAAGGEVIGVAAGVYTEAGIAVGKEVAIVGSGADVTIVQAHASYDSASDRVFTVTAAADVTIADMTIRHGRHTDNGGGIYMRPAATGTYSYIIDGCEIVDNISNCAVAYNKGGGGLYAFTPAEAGYDLTLIVSDSTVEGNYCASRGGGIYIERGNNSAMAATIENCTIAGNQADGTDTQTGGGIALQNLDNGDIYNCTIAANTAGGTGGGGGIAFRYGSYDLCNSIVAGNTDTNGDQEDIDRGGGTINESYNVIGVNEMGGTDLESGAPNGNGSHIGTTGTPVAANLAALTGNGGTTRTMLPTSGAALRLVPRGSEPYYNDSPAEDQRGYWIDTPTDDPDYLNRTAGSYWDAASATPARGFHGWTE